METIGFREFYDRDGFVVIPGLLGSAEVADIRRQIDEEFAVRPGDFIITSRMLELPNLYRVLFLEAITRLLKDVLGSDFTLYPNFNIQKNSFGPPGVLHRDSDSEGKKKYLCQSDYRFVKCGLYLQDNDQEWGGGINVTYGTHHFPIVTGVRRIDFPIKRIRDTIAMRSRERTLRLKAGDFVIFDSRLAHTSTAPARLAWQAGERLRSMPVEHTKYVIYWDASGTAPYVAEFMHNSARRAEKEFSFANYCRLRFPESFPEDFVAAVKRAGINVAQLDRAEALRWEEVYRKGVTAAYAGT